MAKNRYTSTQFNVANQSKNVDNTLIIPHLTSHWRQNIELKFYYKLILNQSLFSDRANQFRHQRLHFEFSGGFCKTHLLPGLDESCHNPGAVTAIMKELLLSHFFNLFDLEQNIYFQKEGFVLLCYTINYKYCMFSTTLSH